MKFLDLTFNEPAENLACDEALLNWCGESGDAEILRVWESKQSFVVLGRSNSFRREVNVEACEARGVPILRRCSGGGTVLQAPGCLNYAVALQVSNRPEMQTVSGANRSIMERHRSMLQRQLRAEVQVSGHTDLVVANRNTIGHNWNLPPLKVSGNAQRRTRHQILFHGTFLVGLDLGLVGELLAMPSLQPGYRQGRPHAEFVTNLNLSRATIVQGLREAWNANEPFTNIDQLHVLDLVKSRYGTSEWNTKL